LARRAVVRRDALADFENGSRTLSPDNLAAIALRSRPRA
jgi:hypothetical protein